MRNTKSHVSKVADSISASLSLYRDMALSAQLSKLRYVHDDQPGFSRKRHGKNFRYLDTDGKPLKNPAHLARIKSLAIPPAWTKVWICPFADGHLQAIGWDGKGRKQYRYNKQWHAVRDEVKYLHMIDFGMQLPLIRRKVEEDLARPKLSREKVLATIIHLLENTLIRIGNDEYAKTNKSFGLTTLRNRHVEVNGSEIRFHFRGKSKVEHEIRLQDPRLARIVRRIRDLPGQELFQYVNGDGQCHSVGSSDVNEYLKEITGRDYTAKDFRTWFGTLHAALELKMLDGFNNEAEAKRNVLKALEATAKKLGNTPAICRKCYVHPLLIESYMAGEMLDLINAPEMEDKEKALEYVESYILKLLQRKSGPVA